MFKKVLRVGSTIVELNDTTTNESWATLGLGTVDYGIGVSRENSVTTETSAPEKGDDTSVSSKDIYNSLSFDSTSNTYTGNGPDYSYSDGSTTETVDLLTGGYIYNSSGTNYTSSSHNTGMSVTSTSGNYTGNGLDYNYWGSNTGNGVNLWGNNNTSVSHGDSGVSTGTSYGLNSFSYNGYGGGYKADALKYYGYSNNSLVFSKNDHRIVYGDDGHTSVWQQGTSIQTDASSGHSMSFGLEGYGYSDYGQQSTTLSASKYVETGNGSASFGRGHSANLQTTNSYYWGSYGSESMSYDGSYDQTVTASVNNWTNTSDAFGSVHVGTTLQVRESDRSAYSGDANGWNTTSTHTITLEMNMSISMSDAAGNVIDDYNNTMTIPINLATLGIVLTPSFMKEIASTGEDLSAFGFGDGKLSSFGNEMLQVLGSDHGFLQPQDFKVALSIVSGGVYDLAGAVNGGSMAFLTAFRGAEALLGPSPGYHGEKG